jgi:uncharacterized protein
MMGFFFRLIPSRPTFAVDMSESERATMTKHVAYWTRLLDDGKALAFGPVLDGDNPHGVGIILAADLDEAIHLRDEDPAVQSLPGFRTEIVPFTQLVTPQATYVGAP